MLTHTKRSHANRASRRQPRQPRQPRRRAGPSAADQSRPTRACLGRAGLLAALALGVACHSYRPAPTPLPPGDARVRVRFGEPRDLRAVAGGVGDTLAWPRVAELVGRVTGLRGDTLDLRVESVRRADDAYGVVHRPAAPAVASVVPAAGDRVETRRFDGGKTALAVLGTLLALLAVGLAAQPIGIALGGG